MTLFEHKEWKRLQNNVIILKNNELFTIKQLATRHSSKRNTKSVLFEGGRTNHKRLLCLCVCGREREADNLRVLFKSEPAATK